MRPLFVPLKTSWFRAFEAGTKRVEYRLYGPRWNEGTCPPGRPVTLSHGYSGARLHGTVRSFRRVPAHRVPDALTLYPADATLAAISIELRE